MDWKIGAMVIGGSALVACGGDGRGAPSEVEAGPAAEPNEAERLMHPDDGPGCVGVPLDFDQPYEGRSLAEVFAPWEAPCTAPFSWDGSGSGAEVIPENGQTQVTVRVDLDPSLATVVRPRPGAGSTCPDTIEVPATLDLQTEDGRFSEKRQVSLRYEPRALFLGSASFTVGAAEAGGSLSASAGDGKTVALSYRIEPLGNGCTGEIHLTVSQAIDAGAGRRGGAGSGAAGPFATWSAAALDAGARDASTREAAASDSGAGSRVEGGAD